MFEFDKHKSESNERKHGISFESARRLWKDPNRIEISARLVDEPRFLLLAKNEETIWSAVFSLRENRIRIISVRKARDYEKENSSK